jgi:hypothetical protein
MVKRGVVMLGTPWGRGCAAALFAALILAAATSARAQEVLFEDDYSVLDAGIGEGDDTLGVRDGALFRKLEPNMWWRTFYQSMVFEDADITIKVQLPDWSAEQGAGVGVMFWGVTADEMYLLEISDSGTFAVRRFAPNRYLYPVFWRTSDAIKIDPGAWNELRVVTRGNWATAYINGQEVAKFKGHAPEGGSLVGLFFETGASAADEGMFSALKITEPAPGEAPPAEDPNVLLADDFSTLDPGWGAESGAFSVKDGKLAITPDADKVWTKLWEGDVFSGDFDASIKLHVKRNNNEEFPMGSLVFWATGWDDYWAFQLYPDGTIGVIHWLKNRWLYPMKGKMAPAEAKFDPNGMTELRVATEGRKATFFVNGVNVGTVSGMPPKEGSYFGTYNESSKSGATLEYDDLVVKRKYAAPLEPEL